MTDKIARKVVQVSFLVLFLYPLVPLIYERVTARGMPVLTSWLLPFDPLLYVAWMLHHQAITLAVTLPLLLVVLTLFGGRFFCGWVGPLGTLFDLISGLALWRRMPRGRLRAPGRIVQWLTLPGGNSYIKYWLLAGLLALAIGSLQLAGFFDPLVVFNRLSVVTLSDTFALGSLAFGLYLSFSFLGVVLIILELWRPRFWCRHLCPLGAFLSLLAPYTILNRQVSAACNDCSLCYRVCAMRAIPLNDFRHTNRGDCTLCLECEAVCPKKAISFGLGNLKKAPAISPVSLGFQAGSLASQTKSLLSRREFLGSMGVAGATLALIPGLKMVPKRPIVRPPGALPEEDFVSTCIICQECVRVCPTNGLQPALFEAGIGAIGTPYLAPRKGGCLLNRSCPHLCARVCPVGAIQLLDQAKMRVGLAKVDRDRCLAWAQGVKCLVCVEACPKDAATPHQGRVYVNPERCSGCGLCEKACPVVDSAIHVTLEQEVRYARGQAPPPPEERQAQTRWETGPVGAWRRHAPVTCRFGSPCAG